MDYLVKDNICREALNDFMKEISINSWLRKYADLYESITYGPNGLPKVVDCHFDGEFYEYISEFADFYEEAKSFGF